MARQRQGPTGRSRTQGRAHTPRPIAGPAAFRDVAEPSHVLSQAATLLLIGAHLRGDTAAARARAEASGKLLHPVARRRLQAIPPSDLSHLGFPHLPAGAPRLQPEALQRMAGVRFASAPAPTPSRGEARTATATLRRAASAFYRDASHETAGVLVEVALRHPRELVRAAAAASYFLVAADPSRAIPCWPRCSRPGRGARRGGGRGRACSCTGRGPAPPRGGSPQTGISGNTSTPTSTRTCTALRIASTGRAVTVSRRARWAGHASIPGSSSTTSPGSTSLPTATAVAYRWWPARRGRRSAE